MRRRAEAEQGELSFATPMDLKDLQQAKRKEVIELLCRLLRTAAASKSANGGAEDER
jgi:hypothetical protein